MDELEILFETEDLHIDGPSEDQLYKIYGCFLDDFHKTPLVHRGKTVTFNKNRTRHPLFKGKFDGFVHIVTRKSNYKDRREFDKNRANRIHWIKPILNNWQNSEVSYFERINDKGVLQYYYWAQSLNFLVILKECTQNLLLMTAYCVDEYNISQYRKYLNEYRKSRS